MKTMNILTEQLQDLGLTHGDTIMLHASMRAIGKETRAEDIIQAVLDIIGSTGTLMMYIGCEPEFEAIGRGKLTPEQELELLQNCPAFDPSSSRARKDYGIVAEIFRQWPGVVVSGNPGARIAALGSKAEWIVADHPLNYGYGVGSPLARLCEAQGKVLLLGSDLDQVTLLHYAEHIAPIANKRIVDFKVPLNINGERTWIDVEEYDTSIGIRRWPNRFFATILAKYLKEHEIQLRKVGHAESYLIDAQSLMGFAAPIFVKGAEIHSC